MVPIRESAEFEMKNEVIGHITPVGGNVFLDLGFAPDEAAALKAETMEAIRLKILAQSKKPSETLETDE